MLLPERRALGADRRGGGRARAQPRPSQRRAECVHPGPVGLDHRDHGLRDGRPAADEPGALRRSPGAGHAGRRRGARPHRPGPSRRPRSQPVAHRDQERARRPAAAGRPGSRERRRSPTSSASRASRWRRSARPSAAPASRRSSTSSRTPGSCSTRPASNPRSITLSGRSRRHRTPCWRGRSGRR